MVGSEWYDWIVLETVYVYVIFLLNDWRCAEQAEKMAVVEMYSMTYELCLLALYILNHNLYTMCFGKEQSNMAMRCVEIHGAVIIPPPPPTPPPRTEVQAYR